MLINQQQKRKKKSVKEKRRANLTKTQEIIFINKSSMFFYSKNLVEDQLNFCLLINIYHNLPVTFH